MEFWACLLRRTMVASSPKIVLENQLKEPFFASRACDNRRLNVRLDPAIQGRLKAKLAAEIQEFHGRKVAEVNRMAVAGTVKVYLDGVEQASGWSVDTTTGLVTFGTAPALGVEVTADFEFDVPVRFDTDHMAVTIETYRLHNWQQIPIVELRT